MGLSIVDELLFWVYEVRLMNKSEREMIEKAYELGATKRQVFTELLDDYGTFLSEGTMTKVGVELPFDIELRQLASLSGEGKGFMVTTGGGLFIEPDDFLKTLKLCDDFCIALNVDTLEEDLKQQQEDRYDISLKAVERSVPEELRGYSFSKDFNEYIASFLSEGSGDTNNRLDTSLRRWKDEVNDWKREKLYELHSEDIKEYLKEKRDEGLRVPVRHNHKDVMTAMLFYSEEVSEKLEKNLWWEIKAVITDLPIEAAVRVADAFSFSKYKDLIQDKLEDKYLDLDSPSLEQMNVVARSHWFVDIHDDVKEDWKVLEEPKLKTVQSPIVSEAEQTLGKDWKREEQEEQVQQQRRGLGL